MIALSQFETGLAVWTIRIALIFMVGVFVFRLGKFSLTGTVLELAKSFWLLGSFFSLLHALLTMAFYHQFQHDLAYADTAKQSEAVIGVAVGWGIYFNYAFVLIWLLGCALVERYAAELPPSSGGVRLRCLWLTGVRGIQWSNRFRDWFDSMDRYFCRGCAGGTLVFSSGNKNFQGAPRYPITR